MREIEDSADIDFLANRFYSKIIKDELLSPIFNRHIPEENWPKHLSKLTDFLETNLFGVTKFKGNPSLKHSGVDKVSNYKIDRVHFGKMVKTLVFDYRGTVRWCQCRKSKKSSP